MAYLHCHSCDWSQDDFWSRRYNPMTKIWTDIKWLCRPRWFEMDDYAVEELCEYTGVKVFTRSAERPWPGQIKVHSWNWLLLEFVKEFKVFRTMKWMTWESWKKECADRTDTRPVCPGCGNQDFDID